MSGFCTPPGQSKSKIRSEPLYRFTENQGRDYHPSVPCIGPAAKVRHFSKLNFSHTQRFGIFIHTFKTPLRGISKKIQSENKWAFYQ
jgi:hypothetical protein